MPTHRGTQTIETPRLILRRATLADAQAMFDHWASDPQVTRYLMWPAHTSTDITRQVLQSWVNGYQQDNFYQWLMVHKDLGQPIGSISGMTCEGTSRESDYAQYLRYHFYTCEKPEHLGASNHLLFVGQA